MGYGLPCLASDIPEIREVLPDPELLFSPDQHAALVSKLERFLQLPGYATVIKAKTAACQAGYASIGIGGWWDWSNSNN